MSYLRTVTVLGVLKDFISAIRLDPDDPNNLAPLFEVVELHKNRSLAEAIHDLVILQKRICLIVPHTYHYKLSNISHTTVSVLSSKDIEVDLLIADKAFTKGGQEAVFGGNDNLGVIELADRTIEAVIGQSLGFEFGGIIPMTAVPITVADPKAKDNPGRECCVQTIIIPAGNMKVAVS